MALGRALSSEGHAFAYQRALRAIDLMHPSVSVPHPYVAERRILENHYAACRKLSDGGTK
jgi:hypothetical protein